MGTETEFGAPTPLWKVTVSLTADAEARMFVWELGPREKEDTYLNTSTVHLLHIEQNSETTCEYSKSYSITTLVVFLSPIPILYK